MSPHPVFAEILHAHGLIVPPAQLCYAAEQLDYLRRQGVADRQRYSFGPWTIYYDPPPIPPGIAHWHFYHKDDDGAPDGYAGRSGSTGTLRDALTEIDMMLDDMAEDCACSVVTLDDCKGMPCPLRFRLEATGQQP